MFHILNLCQTEKDNIKYRKRAICIGGFDGVHLGHQALIRKLIVEAKKRSLISSLIILEPHAQEYFAKKQNIASTSRIMSLANKIYKIINIKNDLAFPTIDELIILPFRRKIAELTALDFINIISNQLNTKYWLMGLDFRFGRDRIGNFEFIQKHNTKIELATLESINDEFNLRFSSTKIRIELNKGELKKAKNALGEDYGLIGRVQSGKHFGRRLLAPTANVHFKYPPPLSGVFAGFCRLLNDNEDLPAVINVGRRPTIENKGMVKLEAHLLNIQEIDLYQKKIKITFIEKIRDEIKFKDQENLKLQIAKDIKIAKGILNI